MQISNCSAVDPVESLFNHIGDKCSMLELGEKVQQEKDAMSVY